jgi:nicotinate-nucleotide adenylyltransferase
MRKKIGLFFGSFNPIHSGHLMIAAYMADQTDLDEVWLVVTPHNPLKQRHTLANDYDRLHLVQLATEPHPKLYACDLEFYLPKPSYTIDTLTHLRERHPQHDFVLIIGGDNLNSLPKWKNYELILRDYAVYVYRRPQQDLKEAVQHPHIRIFDQAPLIEISSTWIRELCRSGKPIHYWVPPAVEEAIDKAGMYLN